MNRRDFDPWGEPAPLPDYVLKTEADKQAVCAFIYAAVIFGLIGFALGLIF